MKQAGYLASLEMTTNWLNTCKYVITYENEQGFENTIYVKEGDNEWYIDIWLPSKNYNLLAVAEIDKAEIPAIAKGITDRLAKRYGYVHQEGEQ